MQRQVSFTEAVERGFQNYANFCGRASRSEYWWWLLFQLLICLFATIVGASIGAAGAILTVLVSLGMFLPSLSVAIRRLHDVGHSGWWYLLGIIPVIGAIVLLVWYCSASEPQSNRFGDVPNIVE